MQITHVYKTDYMRLCKQGIILACILALLVIKVNATSVTVTQREVYFYKSLPYAFVFTDRAMAKEWTWTKSTQVKYKSLVALGMKPAYSEALIDNCKKVKESAMCVKIWASIMNAESQMWKRCYNNNCFWMNAWGKSYKNVSEWIKHWTEKWDKYWYKQKHMSSFYSRTPWVQPKTAYCLSEHQPNWKTLNYCPNGYKNSMAIFSKINW